MATTSLAESFTQVGSSASYTSTSITAYGEAAHDAKSKARNTSRLSYCWRVMRWMWAHRAEPNNRAKWRRMAKEIDG